MEKTAASAILKGDDVTEDVGHLEIVEKTAATKDDDVTEASRRGVFPNPSRDMKSPWEKLFQSSEEGYLSNPEQFQDDPRTFARDRWLGGDDRQTADRRSSQTPSLSTIRPRYFIELFMEFALTRLTLETSAAHT